MASPFPGMDPYLEGNPYWTALHSNLITAMEMELKKRLPRRYTVWPDIHIWLHEPDAATRLQQFEPDVLLSKKSNGKAASAGLATLAAPATSLLPAIRRKGNRYLKIRESRSERVVTVIELLSPSNKTPGDGYEDHLAKRNEYLATRTNLVEIDLLRRGRRMPMGKPRPPKADYYALVCRSADFPRTSIWPWSVRERLPEIPIPLDPKDGYVMLPLQACFDWAYDVGPFDNAVDYHRPPKVRLNESDAAWARKWLAAALARSR